MKNLDVDKLLELKKQTQSPENDYALPEQFLANFRLCLQQRRRRQHTVQLALAASLILLCGLMMCSLSLFREEGTSGDGVVLSGNNIQQVPIVLLSEMERLFGMDSGVLFVNDQLVLYERLRAVQPEYQIRLQLTSQSGKTLATLEFYTSGDDYIVVDDGQVAGSIFLNRCDDRSTILELNLSLDKASPKAMRIDEIFAFDPDQVSQIVSNGLIVRVDVRKPRA